MTVILKRPNPIDGLIIRGVRGVCKHLHLMPPPVTHYKMETYLCPPDLLDANGHIPEGLRLDKLGIEPSIIYHDRARSWVRNAYNMVVTQMCGIGSTEGAAYGAGGMYIKDTGGNNRSTVNYTFTLGLFGSVAAWVGAGGSAARGIVVGTGVGAESFEDYALGTLIANGTGAGQMSYVAQETTAAAYTAGTKTWAGTLIRYMNNNSGGSIDVGEAGMYVGVYAYNVTFDTMLCRDLQDPVVPVANTAQLKVTYTITSMAYPA